MLERSLIHASDFLSKLEETAISPKVSYPDLRKKLSYPISENGINPEQVIVKDGIMDSTSGRYYRPFG